MLMIVLSVRLIECTDHSIFITVHVESVDIALVNVTEMVADWIRSPQQVPSEQQQKKHGSYSVEIFSFQSVESSC